MSRLVVGPFNRVEGDLEVKLDIDDGEVRAARVVSTLYRGFERILRGKPPMDALVYAPRICGICSVSQSVAAARALGSIQALSMPQNGELALNLIHAVENIADHLTHFYLFFMPDFARPIYKDEAWYADVSDRFTALAGTATRDMLPARAQFMHIMGILAGKWPHTLAIQPGGTTRSVSNSELARLSAILVAFRQFLERHLFGDTLEAVTALTSRSALEAWSGKRSYTQSDFRMFLHASSALKLENLGRATDHFLSYGAYHLRGDYLFAQGTWKAGKTSKLDISGVTEDVSSAWYETDPATVAAPYQGTTLPDVTREDAYTWCKAPRLGGNVYETGAIARQVVAGNELIIDLVKGHGANVHSRVVARLIEIALITLAMERWINAIKPGEAFCAHSGIPDDAQGVGLTEAARGALGHWLVVRKGVIHNYQIIAPTTWNFSPRDSSGTPGALEQALVGAPIRAGEVEPISVQHIVRSFDPCLVCTVH